MRLLLIGCEMIREELGDAAARSPHEVEVRFLPRALHDQGARAMRSALQTAIDAAEPGRWDAIALGYGLCGNGLAGVEARAIPLVVPRAHDCITLLIGDRARFARDHQDHPGTYYRSKGWIDHGQGFDPAARRRTGVGQSLAELIARYGEDNGRYLHEEFNRYRAAYQRLAFVATGLEPDPRWEDQARREAEQSGWQFETIPGELSLFRRLLAGDWGPGDFLWVPPHHRIIAAHEDHVMDIEAIES